MNQNISQAKFTGLTFLIVGFQNLGCVLDKGEINLLLCLHKHYRALKQNAKIMN